MTIEKLGSTTILVTLRHEDLRRYNLDFDAADTEETLRGLKGLLPVIGASCDLVHRGRSCLIEALPGKDGWLLIISVRRVRRRYRIKRTGGADCCRFFDADAMLGWLSHPLSGALCGELYALDDGYLLLSDRPWPPRERAALHEFGSLTRESSVAAARIREFARPLSTAKG